MTKQQYEEIMSQTSMFEFQLLKVLWEIRDALKGNLE